MSVLLLAEIFDGKKCEACATGRTVTQCVQKNSGGCVLIHYQCHHCLVWGRFNSGQRIITQIGQTCSFVHLEELRYAVGAFIPGCSQYSDVAKTMVCGGLIPISSGRFSAFLQWLKCYVDAVMLVSIRKYRQVLLERDSELVGSGKSCSQSTTCFGPKPPR